ncbi:glycosyltransferase [filamentous cyanobacterium CCP5]|nr:glycosyltransferase [filamentous cyanobacterium CCP5]
MASSYGNLPQADWLWKQTPRPFGRWGNIQMQALAPTPDYLLLYQLDFHKLLAPPQLTWRQRLRGRRHQPVNIAAQLRHLPKDQVIFLLREPPLPEVLAANQHNYALAQDYCGYVSGPDDSAPTPDYMPAIWYVDQPFQHLDQGPPPEKLRPCSWITSGISRTENHRQRLEFLQQVQEHELPVDIYGRGLPIGINGLGPLQNKWSGMAPYYYNLAIENYAENDWYVSEKLWDALLSWCLPIYYGGSAADRLLPPGSFLRLPSQDEQGLAYIREVIASPDAWYEAKGAIAEARQIILHKLNLLNWLSEYVERA